MTATKNETKQTPTPWVAEGSAVENEKNRGMVADCFDNGNGSQEDNAAFIVRAVNAHEALVEASRKALSALIAYQPPTGKQSFVIREAIDGIQTALAIAEVRP